MGQSWRPSAVRLHRWPLEAGAGGGCLCVERGVLLSVGNDAHSLDDIPLSDDAQGFIDSLGLTDADLWHPLSFD